MCSKYQEAGWLLITYYVVLHTSEVTLYVSRDYKSLLEMLYNKGSFDAYFLVIQVRSIK